MKLFFASQYFCLLRPAYRDKTVQASNQTMVTLQEVQAMCAEIQSFRSNCANDDVTVLETSLLDCYGLLNLHHVSAHSIFHFLNVTVLFPTTSWPVKTTTSFATSLSSLSHFVNLSSTWTYPSYG